MTQPGSKIAVIAIDGPAGAGKSTVARRVADQLGFDFLDTGAMYRAATWRAMTGGVDLNDSTALIESTRAMQLEMHDGRVRVDGTDVTDAIRTPEVTRNIRCLDGIPEVRARLGALQREIGCAHPTVAEGRDMGTVVFPDAACKIFLEAGLDERARRRSAELALKGTHANVEDVMEDIRVRDENDTMRATSPLRAAADARRIDTTGLTVDEVVERVVGAAREALNAR